ncbi:hypothetical protein J437_LFUL000289 [Ladona fulva]|uniref:Uncharacterized protein n=1 Tax=Ladona fulva TaxID=123851 RepID=A0A8K0P0T5_LADFU|nr:hypothetical protein J437_LFUL000289 [Ladona fulva]
MSIIETPLHVTASCVIRSVIRFLTISSVYDQDAMSIQMVRRWQTIFIEGRETVHDEERSGSTITSRQAEVIDAGRETIAVDKRLSLDEILENLRGDVLGHPTYSIDLVPSDYYLFSKLKNILELDDSQMMKS